MGSVEVVTADGFDELYDVYARSYTRDFDGPWLSAEKRVNLTDDEYGTKVAVIVRDGDGLVAGGGYAIMPLRDNVQTAFVDVFTVPERRRQGLGSQVLTALLEAGRAHDRSQAFAAAVWPVGEDGAAGRWFAEHHGFTLDLTEAVRELPLPAHLPDVVLADGYTLETWRGRCPDEWVDEYADLRRILTQEAPSGEAGLENEHWDAARVRQDEANLVRVGRQIQVVVARADDGEGPGRGLAGHTQLVFPGDGAEVWQWDTLVRPEHRGHGLGLALKVHAMRAASDLLAGRRRVTTYNAASNANMISVNERLGFRQTAWVGEYVRTI